ncbi:MAG TPA: cellulase family glycosylhydrolase [Acidobacteriaceae bacterium]|jgi:aryl-phospho-beta-D-glucosidase BglC (GH1 family)
MPATAATDDSVAARRAAVLQRGVNLSGWFASSGDLSPQHFDTYTTPADLQLIHDAGMQNVRLGVDPVLFTQHGLNSAESTAALARLDLAIDEILQAGLAVQIVVFPRDDYKQQLANQKGVDDFVMLWRFLAGHFAHRDPERVFFELMNEPEVNDPYRWMGIQATVVDAIRKVDGVHTIIATAAHYSGLGDLLVLQPVNDANVIYNFHFYEPYPFTHQGATWGSSEWNYFHDIPYPATPETLKSAMSGVQDDSARNVLFQYGAAGWNQQTMLARLQFARDWADEHHVPLICNEFGAYRDTAPADSRVRYIHDVRSDLEHLHIGWAMWDYRGNFGMVARTGPVPVPDERIFGALGLTTR